MMTKLAHMRANRKNNKGFSLVELIIVIAIMVALIAVMGPQYVKYIQKSRDSALATAAEDLVAYIKTAYADTDDGYTGAGTINVYVDASNDKIRAEIGSGATFKKGADALTETTLLADAGASANAKMGQSKDMYTITVAVNNGTPSVTMVKTTRDAA